MDPNFFVALFWLEGSLRHKGMFNEAVALRQTVYPEKAKAIEHTFRTDGFQPFCAKAGRPSRRAGPG